MSELHNAVLRTVGDTPRTIVDVAATAQTAIHPLTSSQ